MSLISSNAYLSVSQMTDNAKYIYNFFRNLGWTANAICGMLGNMQRESTINPGVWQNLDYENYNGGFGLVQWTPATNLTNWASSRGLDRDSIETQCVKIQDEYENGGQYYPTDDYPLTFSQFASSTETPEYLAEVFCRNYERAGVEAMDERKTNARYWYDELNVEYWTRTERAEYGNPYYNNSASGINPHYSTCITGSPTVAGLNVLCNCVGLANGAFNETYVRNTPGASEGEHYAFNSNANRFIELARNFGIETLNANDSPPLGGMVVWGGTANHVAYISQVIDNNTIVIHQSGWDTPSWEWDIRTVTRNQNGTNMWGYRGTCLGFVVNPAVGGYNPPEPTIKAPEITNIESISSTQISVSGISNGSEQVTLYIKWNSSTVSQSNYDTTVVVSGSSFSINIEKPRRASSVAILPIRNSYAGDVFTKDDLIVSIPCINIYENGKMLQAIPYIYISGQWRECVPNIYTSGQWREIYNDKN